MYIKSALKTYRLHLTFKLKVYCLYIQHNATTLAALKYKYLNNTTQLSRTLPTAWNKYLTRLLNYMKRKIKTFFISRYSYNNNDKLMPHVVHFKAPTLDFCNKELQWSAQFLYTQQYNDWISQPKLYPVHSGAISK